MRLFVSLPLDEAMRRHVRAIAGALVIEDCNHDVIWFPPENLHVTLKFLGEVNDPEFPMIIEALRRVKWASVGITVGAPDSKRHAGRVHLITTELLDDRGDLRFLHGAIERELEPLGFPSEKRPFWPHITIGRSRRGVPMQFERFSSRGVVGAIDRFELMSSQLGAGAPMYVPVATFPLAG